eukprot:1953028-Rhodomonas_salina.1
MGGDGSSCSASWTWNAWSGSWPGETSLHGESCGVVVQASGSGATKGTSGMLSCRQMVCSAECRQTSAANALDSAMRASPSSCLRLARKQHFFWMVSLSSCTSARCCS